MRSSKGLVLTAIVLFGALFFAFKVIDSSNGTINITTRQRLLNAIGSLLEEGHYSPKKINDDFSKALKELQSIVMASRLSAPIQAARYQQLLSLLLG